LCAAICVIVFLLFLLVIPSRINIRLGNDDAAPAPQTQGSPADTEHIEADQIIFTDKPITIVPVPAQQQPPARAPAPTPPPVSAQPVPSAPPPADDLTPQPIRYRIKWGDTLWDIAWAYYRNPWRYTYIAQYNGIKNPDHIIAGTYILIPPR
jgi:nucleoid-associated protein YgaU